MLEKFSEGESIPSYCTECKLNLDHTIVAVNGAEIVKVKCMACGSTHKYRNASAIVKRRSPRKKEDTARTNEVFWETCLAASKGKEITYEMTGKYHVGDIVLHHVFGKGIVRKLYLNKCDVLFKDKERLMASAN